MTVPFFLRHRTQGACLAARPFFLPPNNSIKPTQESEFALNELLGAIRHLVD